MNLEIVLAFYEKTFAFNVKVLHWFDMFWKHVHSVFHHIWKKLLPNSLAFSTGYILLAIFLLVINSFKCPL